MKCKICGSRTVAENSVDDLCAVCETKYNMDWEDYNPQEKVYSSHRRESDTRGN